jgi:tellurite resistance protein TehA-like permease
MRETRLTIPEVGIIGATRGLLGAGVALLLAERVPEARRKTVGWTLFSIGALTTLPLAFIVLTRSRRVKRIPRHKPDRAAAHPSNDLNPVGHAPRA